MATLQGGALFVLAGLAYLLLASVALSVILPLAKPALAKWSPASRHRALMVLAALPLLTALVLLLAASAPAFVSVFVPELDHCTLHEDAHPHLCFVHMPKVSLHAWALGMLLVLGLLAAWRLALGVRRWSRATEALRTLAQTSCTDAALGVRVIETRDPVCLTTGLLRPSILLSRGLLNTLTEEERGIVLLHERAHIARRDLFSQALAQAFACLHLKPARDWILRELALAAEQASDEAAAQQVGDRLAVASALLRVERLAQGQDAARFGMALAFGGKGHGSLTRRVESLLQAPVAQRSLMPHALVALLCAATLLALGGQLHHLTESLLSIAAH